jgi:hypothetical protein
MSENKNENFQTSPTAIAPIYLGLVHWPILDRAKNIVCTNVTNFDVHDIARASTAYNLKTYYVINRMREQLMFVSRLLDHWRLGTGSQYNPMRKTALSRVKPVEYIGDAIKDIEPRPFVVATSARQIEGVPRMTFKDLRARIEENPQPVLLLFGTGFGLAPEAFEACDAILEPIKGVGAQDYRHLSVRSAVSICLDRLLGAW